MATTLVPTYRMEFSYVVTGLLHKVRHYVNVDTSTPVKILKRDGTTAITPAAAAAGFVDAFQSGYGVNQPTAFGWIFQHLVTGVWLPVATGTEPNENTVTTPQQLGAQVTSVFRDTAFKKVRLIELESIVPGPFHFANLAAATSFNAALGGLLQQYDSTFTVTNPPFEWVVGRSGNYLATNPLVGVTWDLNDKVRRARNLT